MNTVLVMLAVVKIACVGDSITSGYGLDNPERDAYPAQLQKILGDGYEVGNFGRPGLGVYLHLPWTWHNDNGKRAWQYSTAYPAALEFKPDIVIAGLGSNDWDEFVNEFTPKEDGSMKLERGTFKREYIELLESFRKVNANVKFYVWINCTPVWKPHEDFGSFKPFIIIDDLKEVAKSVGAGQIDVYLPLLKYRETDFSKDGVHLLPGAAKGLAEAVAASIR